MAIKRFEGVIRRVNDTTWTVLDSSDGHDDINISGVTVSGSTLLVTWDYGTPARVIYGSAHADEQYVKLGIHFGTAMNASNLGIYAYMNNSGGKVLYDGANFVVDTPAFDIADDGGLANINSVSWSTDTLRVLFNAFNTDMPWYYTAISGNSAYNCVIKGTGTASGSRGYVDIYFLDAATGAIETSLNTNMVVYVQSTQPCPVNISKLIDANSNIWVHGTVATV